jgi:putative DNA primase/helicase
MSAKPARRPKARRREASARDDAQSQHALAELVADRFAHDLSLEEMITELGLEAQKLGFETDQTKDLIGRFYRTCASRQTDQEAIARLARMTVPAYERNLDSEAKRLKMRKAALDREVVKLRASTQPVTAGGALNLRTPEPWPEPVDGAVLLDELVLTIERFVVVLRNAAIAIALWMVFTHAIDCFDIAPRLAILSAEMRSGKTTLLRVLFRLVPRALLASNISPAAIFRTIEAAHPTLEIDEADSFARESDELRGLLNSGHTRDGAFVVRVEGENHEPRKFSTWASIVIAAIGTLFPSWLDRSIVIRLKRKLTSEPVERLTRERQAELEILARKCTRWALDNAPALKSANPILIAELDDRAMDNWRPLFAIADAAGAEWPGRARAVALALSCVIANRDSLNVTLIRDIASLFGADSRQRWGSTDLCEKLVAVETSPWATISRGKPITPARLARMLRAFEIYVRQDGAGSYYRPADFADSFARYLGAPPSQSATMPQTLGTVSEPEISKCHGQNRDGTLRSATTSTESDGNGTLAFSDPPAGDEESFEL